MKKNPLKWSATIFSLMGLPFLAIALGVGFSNYSFIQKAEQTTGTVVDLIYSRKGMARPKVVYAIPDGRNYTYVSSNASNPPSFRVDEQVDILYDPKNPGNARIKSFGSLWLLPLIFGAFGTIFMGIGLGIFAHRRKKEELNVWLQRNGRVLEAPLSQVELDTTLSVNGRHPFILLAQWHDTHKNEVYVFKSDSIWYDPTPYLTQDQCLRVLHDPQDLNRYMVDISFLPQLKN